MNISFIIPVHNAENHIQKIISSIINQGIIEDKYEIIMVNDGSTDNTQKVLEELATTYKNLRIIQQENRGPGGARNSAIKIARGDFIFFVDSDDYLMPNTLFPLLKYIGENKVADIIFFNSLQDNKGKLSPYITRPNNIKGEITGAYYLSNYKIYGTIWSAVFSKDFIQKYNLLMPEGIFHQDEVFTVESLVYATKVRFYNYPIYVYVRREGSVTKPNSKEKERRLIDDFRSVITRILLISKNEDLTAEQKKGIERRLDWFAVDMLIRLSRIRFDTTFHEKVLDEMIENQIFPLSSQKYSWKYNVFRMLFRNKKRTLFLFKFGVRF